MDKEELSNIVATIMCNDGPDGHCDGSDIIADFILSYKDGREKEWFLDYAKKGLRNNFTQWQVDKNGD